MIYFALIEALVVFACVFVAKKLVENREKWLNKYMTIGKDAPQIIGEMKNIVSDIISTNKFEMTDKMERYQIRCIAKEGYIQEVVIETTATRMSWSYNEGWKELQIAYSEKGAIAQIAFIIWLITLGIQVALAVIALVVWLSKMI